MQPLMTNRQIDTQAKTQAQPPGLLRWCATLERTAFAMLLTALLWAPWPLGSNRPWALALLGAMLWVGLALAALGRVLQPPQPRHNRAAGWWLPVAAMAAFAALLVLQLLPGLGVDGERCP